jgi:nitroreductase/SAM-dependent methyltransferase
MDIEEAIRNRRSIREFKSAKVPEEIIRKIIQAGIWAPSACNRQCIKIVVISSASLKERLWREAKSQKIVKDAPVVLAVLYDNEINEDANANIQSASASIQNMHLMAHSLGVGTCWVAGYGDEKKVKEILQVPKYFKVVAFVLVGYPKNVLTPPKRRPISEIISYEKFSGSRFFPNSVHPDDWKLHQIRDYQRRQSRAHDLGRDAEHYYGVEKRTILDYIMPKLKGKILDLFSYDGTFLTPISKEKEVTSIEMSEEVCLFLQERLKKSGLQNNNAFIIAEREFPIGDSTFDVATILMKMERFPRESWKHLIGECSRVLKSNGRLIIVIRNSLSLSSVFRVLINYKLLKKNKLNRHFMGLYDVGPFYPIALSEIERSTREYFDIVDINGFYFFPTELNKLKLSKLLSVNNIIDTTYLKRFSKFVCIEFKNHKME